MSPRPLVVLSFVVLAGCPEGTPGDGCDPGAPGDLVIELPDPGLDEPAVAVVLDADGVEVARVSENTTVAALDGGTYRIVTERGIRYEPSSTIDSTFGALHDTVQSVCVGGEPVTVAIEVEPQPSSGRLWVTSGESIVGFSAATLAGGPDVAPDARLDVALINDFRGMSFDPSGNLWAATSPTYGTRLQMYRPDQVDGTGEQEPALTVRISAEDDGVQIADLWVDPEGTVWTLVRFTYSGFVGLHGWTRADLLDLVADGGDVVLEPSIVHEMPEVLGAEDLLVVGDDLFVSVFDSNRVYRYARTSLTGTMTPAAEIWFVDPLDIEQPGPTNMAFADGQIWLTLWTAPIVVPFSPSADGPVLIDPLTAGVTDLPSGMDADATGTVWWGNLDVSGAVELHRFDGATGDPAETLTAADLLAPSDLLFDPVAR